MNQVHASLSAAHSLHPPVCSTYRIFHQCYQVLQYYFCFSDAEPYNDQLSPPAPPLPSTDTCFLVAFAPLCACARV